jgi:predicted phosphodiesterase
MKRTNLSKADFLFLSDLHLRETTPECRTDDFFAAQTRKLQYIKQLQINHSCPVLIAGDIFHHWKNSPYLLSWAIENLPDYIICIPGQHDLSSHNLDLLDKSSLFVLQKAKKACILMEGGYLDIGNDIHVTGFPYGTKSIGTEREEGITKVAMIHELTYSQKLPYPGCEIDNAGKLLKRLKGWDLVICGDNHLQFTATIGNRTLISPGSMMRQTADQADFQPQVYAYYKSTNTITPIEIPIEEGVISREHIDRKQQRDGRIDAFVSRLNSEWEGAVSFEENLERMMVENKTKDRVKQIIYSSLED